MLQRFILTAYMILTIFCPTESFSVGDDSFHQEQSIAGDHILYEQEIDDLDPLEPLNRVFFTVHDIIDHLLLKPLSYMYQDFVAEPIKDGLSNALDNIASPVTLANNILQAEPGAAVNTFGRFLINSTIGLLGIFDAAGAIFDMPAKKETFGDTFEKWGIGSGPYLFIPIFGPSTLRSATGLAVEVFTDPFDWYMRVHNHNEIRYARIAVQGIVRRYKALGITEQIDKTDDRYAQYRILYLQNKKLIDTVEHSAVPDDFIEAQPSSQKESN